MGDVDLTKKTTPELERARATALQRGDMGNYLDFDRELNRRAKAKTTEKAAETTVREQAMSGVNEGIAGILGTPVDLMSAGYEKLTGRKIDRPVGGTEFFTDMMTATDMIREEQPMTAEQRIARGTGRMVGETAAMVPGMVGAGLRATATGANALYGALKNVTRETAEVAVKNPGKFAATEAGAAIGAGIASSSVAELFPENPNYQMLAAMVGAGAGASAAEVGNRLLTKAPNRTLDAASLKREASALYNDQRQNGMSAQPEMTDAIARDAFSYLDEAGYIEPVKGSNRTRIDPSYPKIASAFRSIDAYADKGMTAANIMAMRKKISNLMNDAQGTEKNGLRNLLRIFDDNTGDLTKNIKIANGLYARAMKAEQVEELMELAKLTGPGKNGDMENAYRLKFSELLRRIIKGQERGWSREEIDQIRQIAEGGGMENTLRFIGKFGITGPVSLMGSVVPAGLAMGVTRDPFISAGVLGTVAGVGGAAKYAGGRVQADNIERLYQNIVQNRNLTPEAANRLRAALGTYLAGQATVQ